jgi:hypothetical protein
MAYPLSMSAAGPVNRTARSWLGLLLLAVGLALFAWTVQHLKLDLDKVRAAAAAIGWWFLVILALTVARFALRTAAWLTLAPTPVPFGAAVAATISGDALGNLTPLGVVAGEPAKAMYLRRHGDPGRLLASLLAENFFYSVSVALYVMIASGALLLLFDHLDPSIHLSGVVALSVMAAVLVGAAWLAWQRPAVASSILGRLPVGSVRVFIDRVRLFEQDAYGAAGPGAWRLVIVSACEVGFHLLSLVESWLTFWLLTGVTSIAPALIYDGFNRVVNILFKMIPGHAGFEETGTAILADAIGYAGIDGFLQAMVRKVRMLVFASIGMVLWGRNAR